MGVPLFDRIGKKLYLTKYGEHFKPYAEQIVNLFQSSKEHLHQLENLSYGTLAFGASNFVGVYLIPKILSSFSKQFPNIKINMNITSSAQLLQMLESNKLEFLVLSDQIQIDETRFQYSTFYQDELVLIVNPMHRLAEKEECSVEDLYEEVFIIKPEKSATRIFLEGIFGEVGFTPSEYIEISNHEAIKQGVIHGLGVSIVSKFSIIQEINSGLLVGVPIQGMKFLRGIRYVYNRRKHLSPADQTIYYIA